MSSELNITAEHLKVNWISVLGSTIACQAFGSVWYSRRFGFGDIVSSEKKKLIKQIFLQLIQKKNNH